MAGGLPQTAANARTARRICMLRPKKQARGATASRSVLPVGKLAVGTKNACAHMLTAPDAGSTYPVKVVSRSWKR